MDDLTAFLNARLDEDEAAALAATPGPWLAEPFVYGRPEDGWGDPEDGAWEIRAGDHGVVNHQPYEGGGVAGGPDARHIARHDPARVLREVALKREILSQNRAAAAWGVDNWPLSLRLLAVIWSDHPDYRPEWKP